MLRGLHDISGELVDVNHVVDFYLLQAKKAERSKDGGEELRRKFLSEVFKGLSLARERHELLFEWGRSFWRNTPIFKPFKLSQSSDGKIAVRCPDRKIECDVIGNVCHVSMSHWERSYLHRENSCEPYGQPRPLDKVSSVGEAFERIMELVIESETRKK